MLTASENDNLFQWDRRRKGFYEVYYLTLNDPLRGVACWFRFTLLIPKKDTGRSEAAVWAAFFDSDQPTNNMILKDVFAPETCRFGDRNVYLNIGGSEFFQNGTKGHIKKGHSSIEWDLNWRVENNGYRYYPSIFYRLPFPSTKVTAPNPSVIASGRVVVNGQPFTLASVPLHQGHIWGTGYAHSWAWAHGNAFLEDRAGILSVLSARVKGWLPAVTTINLKTSRGEYRFDHVRSWARNRSDVSLTGWKFEGRDREFLIKGDVVTKPENLIGVSYRAPDGSIRYCYNTEVADSVVELYQLQDKKWHLFQTLTSQKTTAFETVATEPNTTIPVYL